jgi:hypothetical protein
LGAALLERRPTVLGLPAAEAAAPFAKSAFADFLLDPSAYAFVLLGDRQPSFQKSRTHFRSNAPTSCPDFLSGSSRPRSRIAADEPSSSRVGPLTSPAEGYAIRGRR